MGTYADHRRSRFLVGLRLAMLFLVTPPFLPAQNNFTIRGSRDPTNSHEIIVLRNTASSAQRIKSVTLSGPQSGDFQQTNTCGTTVAAGADCAITVTFSPQAVGVRTAVLQITDSAGNSPQIINLSGTGAAPPSIGLEVPSGASSAATVAAGQIANYVLSIGGAGMSGSATLTCSGVPIDAVCTLPANENISAGAAASFKVSVSTTARTMTSNVRTPIFTPAPWLWATLVMAWVALPFRRLKSSLGKLSIGKPSLRHLPLLLLICFLGSCGGGGGSPSSSSPSPSSSGTPVGTYSLKITATSGSASQSTALSLTVQ